MKKEQRLSFKTMDLQDIMPLTPIMKAAFDEDTRLHTQLMEDGPAGYADGTLLTKLLAKPNYFSNVILYDKQVVGAYTISFAGDHYTLELLFIDAKLSGQGIGTLTWQHIESTYSNAKLWRTETPQYSIRNLHFYTKKCGFVKYGENIHENGEKSILLQKQRVL